MHRSNTLILYTCIVLPDCLFNELCLFYLLLISTNHIMYASSDLRLTTWVENGTVWFSFWELLHPCGFICNLSQPATKFNCILIALFVSLSLRFLADYDEQFPIVDDISLLQQAFPLLYPLLWSLYRTLYADFESNKSGSILASFRLLLERKRPQWFQK